MTSATPQPRAGEHTKGPHITKFGSIKEEGGKLIFNDFEVNCEGGQIGVLSSFMTRLIVMRLLTNLEQEFTAERDLLRERESELVKVLKECLQRWQDWNDMQEDAEIREQDRQRLAQIRARFL